MKYFFRKKCYFPSTALLGVALFSNCGGTWSAMGQVWLFIVAPLVGACLAGLVYKCLGGCKKSEK